MNLEQTPKRMDAMPGRSKIKSWAQFERRVRRKQPKLLTNLKDFDDPILVAGCQRSGTTAVTRIIRTALGTENLRITDDDELDAALVLSGHEEFPLDSRHCFQTTYLNDSVDEYFENEGFRLVWLLRKPQAVVQSMLHNWKYGALRRLFQRCGSTLLGDNELSRYRYFGTAGFSRLRMACLSYNAKTMQTHMLANGLPRERMFIIDYDDLVERKDVVLPALFDFCGLPYDSQHAGVIRRSGKSQRTLLSKRDGAYVERTCSGEYERALRLTSMPDLAR